MPKIIFLTGGVCSSIGKGIAVSSIALYLKSCGKRVRVKKCDPYLNVDPGTLSPFQHGEVFVTADGVETDLDIGHYERFTDQDTKTNDYITSGRVYWDILHHERKGGYNGKTVQVVPHVIEKIREMILTDTDDIDYLLCEIGGTVGDLEASPYYETIRQMQFDMDIKLVHLAYMPYIAPAHEHKTKPVQHSLKELLSLGLRPDIIICRTDTNPTDDSWREKLGNYANLPSERIILGQDVHNTYQMLAMYYDNGLFEQMRQVLKLEGDGTEIANKYKKLMNIEGDKVRIGIVGKYTNLQDSYKSLKEALLYSAATQGKQLDLHWLDSEKLEEKDEQEWSLLKTMDGIIVPGGFGDRGIEGKIATVEYARTHNVPFLGICLGMQVMAVESMRNVAGLKDASSSEWGGHGSHVISPIPAELGNKFAADITSSIRVGAHITSVTGKIADIYNATKASERFRHRYGVSKQFEALLYDTGLEAQAKTDTHIDALVLPGHKFFIGVQYHPEFLAKPLTGHKLFNAFIKATFE